MSTGWYSGSCKPWENSLLPSLLPTLHNTTETSLQLMQLLAEAPAIGVDAGYGVVAEVKLVQRGEAIERATVHFCQAVILQMAVEKNQKELTDKQHWSNAESISKKTGILAIPTHLPAYPWTHACVGISCQTKDRNSRTTQRKCPEGDVTAERSSTANKPGLKHPIEVCICRVSVVWQQHPEICCLHHLGPRKHTWKPSVLEASGISLQWLINILWYGKKTSPRMASLVSRYPKR